MKNYWDDLSEIIMSTWDISFEELLNTHGDFNALIKLVSIRSGKDYNTTRDLLNLMLSKTYSINNKN
jgi:hypothetical protein